MKKLKEFLKLATTRISILSIFAIFGVVFGGIFSIMGFPGISAEFEEVAQSIIVSTIQFAGITILLPFIVMFVFSLFYSSTPEKAAAYFAGYFSGAVMSVSLYGVYHLLLQVISLL